MEASDGLFGLIFGLSANWEEMYTFEIDSSGYFFVYRYGNETWIELAGGYRESINMATKPNQIAIVRDGASIHAFANGDLLASVSDSTFMGDRFLGLMVTNFEQGVLDVRFDNFEFETLEEPKAFK